MDPRQNPDTGAEQDDRVEPDETGRSPGGDVLTMCLFGAMVIIASIFFWIVDTGLGYAFRYIIALGS